MIGDIIETIADHVRFREQYFQTEIIFGCQILMNIE